MKDGVAISVNGVYKSFRLPHEKTGSIKGALINLRRKKRGYEVQHVLKDVSFDIKEGEFFGIVGRNGSGKSTLLKLISQIYTPDKGEIQVRGKLTPFIELGVGFNPELSGRDNVYLNGALLGFSRSEMDEMYDEIVSFAELERFMDQKLKNYSSGMQVRLAFSIAIRSRSEILIFDEVLAVGDADFQRKCIDTFNDLKKSSKTIVLVTHDMGNVERFCDRALVLSQGSILALTNPDDASLLYAKLNVNESDLDKRDKLQSETIADDRPGTGENRVKSIILSQEGNREERIFHTGKPFQIDIKLQKPITRNTKLSVGLAVHNTDGLVVIGPNADNTSLSVGAKTITYRLNALPINSGDYSLTILLYDRETRKEIDNLYKFKHFSVINSPKTGGAVVVDGEWTSSGK